MSKLSDLATLYKKTVVEDKNVEGNSFTDMILQTKNAATSVLDKLACLAGIKAAPVDDKYSSLNTANLSELLSNAKAAGYDVEIISI